MRKLGVVSKWENGYNCITFSGSIWQKLLQVDSLMNVHKEVYMYKHIANMQHRKRTVENG